LTKAQCAGRNKLIPLNLSASSAVRLSYSRHRAFTLVEVMLSLLITLILLYGMNLVFRDTSRAVAAGQAVNQATRNGRAIQSILFNDLNNCAADSPVFIISSAVVPQYLNSADATQSNAAAGATPPASGCLLGDHNHRSDMLMFFARGIYKRKTANHFVNSSGTTYDFLNSTTTSDEAYIHYGHLAVASDGITPIAPDSYAGASEPYAADWVLGRNVILLDGSAATNAGDLANNLEWYYPPRFVGEPWLQGGPTAPPTASPVPAVTVAPFGYNSQSTGYGSTYTQYRLYPANASITSNPPSSIQTSRYDLADVTMDQFRSVITTAAAQAPQFRGDNIDWYYWWAPLIYQQPHTRPYALGALVPPIPQTMVSMYRGTMTVTGNRPPSPYGGSNITGVSSAGTALPGGPLVASAASGNQWFPRFRFQASNILSPSPMTAQDQANLTPYMLEHVSQFIVEYAGDFTTQDVNGNVTDTVPDGQIDWVYATKGYFNTASTYSPGDWVICQGIYYQAQQSVPSTTTIPNPNPPPPPAPAWYPAGNVSPPVAASPPRQIRWYGMPRDSTGSGSVWTVNHINPPTGIAPPTSNEMNNVVPLSDVWQTSANNAGRALPYEMETGPILNAAIGQQGPLIDPSASAKFRVTDYADSTSVSGGTGVPPIANGMSPLARYTTVWRNDVPAMVRILIKVDDPNNNIQSGPWFEYVFKLK
jgi:Prokaryotic N-terminal methylation motif